MNKKIMYITISIFLVILVLFSSTYALLFKSDETDKQSYATGMLEITSETTNNSVTLSNNLPMSDSEGANTTPYTFKITNIGNLSYKFNVMLLSTTTSNQIESQYIKIKVNDNSPVKLSDLTNGIILSDITLKPGKSIEVSLRVWLDENTLNTEIGKSFNAKVTTEGEAIYVNDVASKTLANLGLTETEGTPDFSKTSCSSECDEKTVGIYSTEDDFGTSYYFRGDVENNYVYFAGFYWRIIRINGDGSIRMIYDGTSAHDNGESSTDRYTTNKQFNSSYNDNAYVGYMYGATGASTYDEAHANTNDSTIKTYLDDWYNTNIKGTANEQYVVDTIYCNDRELDSGTGVGTTKSYYKAYNRNVTNKTPTLKCTQVNDRFTVNSKVSGVTANGALTNPIGLITADEVAYAGSVYNTTKNSKYYLYVDNWFWTMSPYNFGGYYAIEFGVGSSGYLYFHLNGYDGVRPVISISADALVGSGTKDAPFHTAEPQPNSPDLVQGLIPVTYNESTSTWVKADSTNADNSWYNYDNKLWANAVLVSDTAAHCSNSSYSTKEQCLAPGKCSISSKTKKSDCESTAYCEFDDGIVYYNMNNATDAHNYTVDCLGRGYPGGYGEWKSTNTWTESTRSTYQSASVGTTITDSDILAFYVWIPRYKYKVWNISKQAGAESTYAYNAKTEGIDIEWETGTTSTGTINCEYNYNVDSANGGVDLSTTTAETCTGSNGDYYTHPAFTFGSDNVKGFWISKFEISSSSPTTVDGGGNVTNLTVRSLPNVNSWRNIQVSKISTVIQNMQTSSNIYGLSTSRTNTDSHMLTNFEWGAVAYLTNSKYGRCTNGSCTEVTINNCSNYITGIGANSVSASSSSATCTATANKYDGTYGKLASTTGNITGVYDMSGGAHEYVMGNMSRASGSYTFYPSSSSFASSWYTADTAKYVTTYANESSSNNMTNQIAYNKGRLGDATAEVVFSTGGSGGWYSDHAYFLFSNVAWFFLGGNYNSGSGAGVFGFNFSDGGSTGSASSRAALVSFGA